MSDNAHFQIIELGSASNCSTDVIAVPRGWRGTLTVAPQGGRRFYVSVRLDRVLVSEMEADDE